ncbi:SDR family NAD(P)-dependent oxidoreductase [Acinetobacter nosocomialis]|uniref:Oxidoreductase n=1 Tax=Acinetobacter nosocomialis TaxID=106654 RepID=A0A2L1VF04_ACINO|nr:SDR family oxidoreductase [Acinetobacter nosocomialis]AVF43735.1 oxidoreductase [Acinetobacter nosocomialis]MBP1500647.1 SDR family oxidoreductase [Acinetobacter nosocomialis]MBR7686097.1 SDR family oxidoreductase [Acinetobacter nosocomialis]MBR7700470.1 SDR family oxidoreductase [Acinetobacter nosocomialis]MBR7759318.1 SDR family oxidoreductase [Acinetobacter nosocomialis]
MSLSNCEAGCVVITGSTKGIGLALAHAFLDLGCSVVIAGRNVEHLNHALSHLETHFNKEKFIGLCCNVTQIADVQTLWDRAIQHFGQVNVWINNAGSCHPTKEFIDLQPDELKTTISTNILGTMLGSQVALKGMLKQGYGQIFNMEGWGGNGEWSAGMTAYATTKRAVSYFSKALYKETKSTPILTGTLSPGMVATDLLVSSWTHGNIQNWKKMKRLFFFVIDPPEVVCAYLAKQIIQNKKANRRIAWITPWKLFLRFLQPYYWRRNPVKGTALEHL